MACEVERTAFNEADAAAGAAYDAEDVAVANVETANLAVADAEATLSSAQTTRSDAVVSATTASQEADTAQQNATDAYIALTACLRADVPGEEPAPAFARTRRRV